MLLPPQESLTKIIASFAAVLLLTTWCLCPWRLRVLGVRLGLVAAPNRRKQPRRPAKTTEPPPSSSGGGDDADDDDEVEQPQRCAPLCCRCLVPERGVVACVVGALQRVCCCACVLSTLVIGTSVALLLVQLYTTHNGDLDALKTALRTRVTHSEL